MTVSSDLQVQRLIPGVEAEKVSLEDIMDINNPVGVEDGILNCEGNYNENGCGALATILTLYPGETKEIAFLVGMKEDVDAANNRVSL